MRDSEIEQWVLREISLTAGGHLKEVCVLSLNGVVNLKGTVPSRADRRATREAAGRARGVVAVINHLSVRKRNLIQRQPGMTSQVAPVAGAFHLPTQETFRSSHLAN